MPIKQYPAVSMPISQLKPWDRNPRRITGEGLDKLQAKIERLGLYKPLVVDTDGVIIGGNMRYQVLQRMGVTEVWATIVDPKDEAQRIEIALSDNENDGEWVPEQLAQLIHDQPIELDLFNVHLSSMPLASILEPHDPNKPNEGSLAEKFIMPPFSVLDTRSGPWQERKGTWLQLGIESEVGRGEDLTLKSTGFMKDEIGKAGGGTSIFDPVLCELMYTWFNVPGGSVLDPFAGGSVRGVIASKLGMPYTGIELRAEQVEANIKQGNELALKPMPSWLQGDSATQLPTLPKSQYDFIFSCPPYADLEKYSDDPADLSNMDYKSFCSVYWDIIREALERLKPNRFAVFVVSEVRSPGYGPYYNFVGDTIQAFLDGGAHYYNELVLINAVGTVRLRAGRQFIKSRKIGKHHQNVLVFYKGDHKLIKDNFPEVELPDEEDAAVTEL